MKKCNLQVGDILFYRDGKSLLSRIIRWGTNSLYSHVLMYIGNGKCIESDFSMRKAFFDKNYRSGVRILSLNEVRQRKGSHDVFRSFLYFSSLKKNAFFMAKMKYEYDFIGLLWRAIVAGKFKFFNKKSFNFTIKKSPF